MKQVAVSNLEYQVSNNVQIQLTSSATDTDTTLDVDDASVLPDTNHLLTLYDSTSEEIVKVTGVDTDNNTITVERGQEDTTAQSWDSGTELENRLTAGTMETLSSTTWVTNNFNNYTDENAQDAVGNIMSGSTDTSVTYDDENDTITVSLTGLSQFDTGNLSEGTNLYYTNERVDDRVNNLLVGGSNVTLTYDDENDTLTIDATDTTYSAGTALGLSGTTFNFTQTLSKDGTSQITGATDINFTDSNDASVTVTDDGDGTATIDVDVTDTDTQLSKETVQDYAWDVTGGTQTLITVTYDDANNIVDFIVDDDLSKYDNSTSGFISGITNENLGDLANVSISSPSSGQELIYNGTNWENGQAKYADLVFEEKRCAVCGERFKEGESVSLIVNKAKEDGTYLIPKHEGC